SLSRRPPIPLPAGTLNGGASGWTGNGRPPAAPVTTTTVTSMIEATRHACPLGPRFATPIHWPNLIDRTRSRISVSLDLSGRDSVETPNQRSEIRSVDYWLGPDASWAELDGPIAANANARASVMGGRVRGPPEAGRGREPGLPSAFGVPRRD